MDGALGARPQMPPPQLSSRGSAGSRVINGLSPVAQSGLVFIRRSPADDPPSFLIRVGLVPHSLPPRTSGWGCQRVLKENGVEEVEKFFLSQAVPVNLNKNKK